MYEYLLTSDNQKIYLEDIEHYYRYTKAIIFKIKSSSQFTIDAQNGDFTKYNEIIEKLKLISPDGKKLSEHDVRKLASQGLIGEKKNKVM